jgi:tyrosine-protein phosphatase YwqE
MGVLYQITAMRIRGNFGRDIRKASFSMIEKGLVDFVAADAHNVKMMSPIPSRAYKEVKGEFDGEIAERLFFHNPGKIVEELKKEASTMSNEEINGLP